MPIPTLRKYINRLRPILEPHISRGENNQLMFSDSGLVLFDNISQYKHQGLTLPEIEKKLSGISKPPDKEDKRGGANLVQTPGQTDPATNKLYDELINLKDQLSQEKIKRVQEVGDRERKISDLEKENLILSSTLKLLPEGKSPEEVKKEYEERQAKDRRKIQLVAELKNAGVFQIKKRRELLKELEDLS